MPKRTPVATLALTGLLFGMAQSPGPQTLVIEDYVAMPMTGAIGGKGSNELLLSRVNALREEAEGAGRFFVTDMNGPLYVFDKKTKSFSVYLDFNGTDGKQGLFRKFFILQGYGNGLNGFNLDPDFSRNGKFYTVHMEDPAVSGSNLPNAAHLPGLDVTGYTTTTAIATPGPLRTEGVLIEWTDTNPANSAFEGTARELLRVQLNTTSHPMGELIFNPTARPGDPDWRVMYLECGDGASGESKIVDIRSNPQRLDNLEGKIARIIPDLAAHTTSSTVSENGRYRIPNDNPFVSTPGARKEIWAYGFRNPHRINWAVDPVNPANTRLVANSVGLHTWESVYLVRKGGNYGYALREGTDQLKLDNTTAPRPPRDEIPLQIGDRPTDKAIVPLYPVIQYGHDATGGDSIGSGYLYQGRAIPALRGKYIFGDLTTGRIWYADYKEMLAADDGKPDTLAKIHPLKIAWNKTTHDDMFTIVATGYKARAGSDKQMAKRDDMIKGGRADVRFAQDASGELYLYSKSDGMIRRVVGAK